MRGSTYKGSVDSPSVNPYGAKIAASGGYGAGMAVQTVAARVAPPLRPSDIVKPGWIKNTGHKTVNVEGVVIKPGEVAELPTTRTFDAALKHQDIEQATPEELQGQEAVRKNKEKAIEKPAPMLEEPIEIA